jgi:hypothetical protein
VQVDSKFFQQRGLTANEYSLIVRVFFDYPTVQDGFNHMPALKALFQSMLNRMALDKVTLSSYTPAKVLNIHTFNSQIARSKIGSGLMMTSISVHKILLEPGPEGNTCEIQILPTFLRSAEIGQHTV